MPLPKPNAGESGKDFLSRCMGNSKMVEEYPDSDQRYAVCQSQLSSKRSDHEDPQIRLFKKDDQGFERLVFAEVLIPEALNTYGDFHTRESVREFAYGFMLNGFGIDMNHDNIDLSDDVHVVESFIARDNDPDFIPGSWVVGMHIANDELWNAVLSGDVNGYSYEAFVRKFDVEVTVPDERIKYGETEPDPLDGHVHGFYVILDDADRPLLGGTTVANNHSHTISSHTFTDSAYGHTHIFNYIESLGGSIDEEA